jgi:glycosyltransferase involved in cell wall biosynthesis
MRIFIVTNMPSPYRVPLFNRMHEEFVKLGWHLKVIFLTRSYERRKWVVNENEFKFDYTYLHGIEFVEGEAFFSLGLSLPKMFFDEQPDLVIAAGFSPAALWSHFYCLLFQKKFIIWSGETIAEAGRRIGLRFMRQWVRSILLSHAHAFVAYGVDAKKYLLSMKIPESKIFIGINTVDTESLRNATNNLRPLRVQYLSQHHLPDLNILFVGYLEKRKGVHLMLEAVKMIQETDRSLEFATHIVGSGTQENELKSFVERNTLAQVHFWGFRQKEELPQFFAISTLLIFPSTDELYGLVPIESMAAGVPVMCSVHAGCSLDLIEDGVNGILIDPYDVNALSQKLIYCLKNASDLATLITNGLSVISERFQISNSVQGFIRCADFVLKR